MRKLLLALASLLFGAALLGLVACAGDGGQTKPPSGAEFEYIYAGNEFPPDDMTIPQGAFVEQGDGVYRGVKTGSIGCFKDKEFASGTYSVDLSASGVSDSGIIMAFDHYYAFDGTLKKSFYAFEIGKDGVLMLFKVSLNTWSDRPAFSLKIWEYAPTNTYNLTLSWEGIKDGKAVINCFLNGSWVYTYEDSSPLTGTGYGLIGGGPNVIYQNIVRTDTIKQKSTDLGGEYQMAFAERSVVPNAGGFDMSERASITTADESVKFDNKKLTYSVSPDPQAWTSFNVMIDSTPAYNAEGTTNTERFNFVGGIGVYFGRKEFTRNVNGETLVYKTAAVLSVEEWGGSWKNYGNYILCDWEDFDRTKTYRLGLTLSGSSLVLYYEDEAVLMCEIPRVATPSNVYFWARIQARVSALSIQPFEADTSAAEYSSVIGSTMSADNRYTLLANSALTATDTAETVGENRKYSITFKPMIGGWPNFRMVFGNTVQRDNLVFPDAFVVAMVTEQPSGSEPIVKMMCQERQDGGWKNYGSHVTIGKYYEFDFEKSYTLDVELCGKAIRVYLDGELLISHFGVERPFTDRLYLWNPGTNAVLVESVTASELTVDKAYKAQFGSFDGNDEWGYVLGSSSAFTTVSDATLGDFDLTAEFTVESGAWPDIRLMFDSTPGTNTFTDGFNVAFKVENDTVAGVQTPKVKVLCQMRNSPWTKYGEHVVSTYAEWSAGTQRTYKLRVRLEDGKASVWLNDTAVLQDVSVGERGTASKFYLWNPSTKSVKISNLEINSIS